MSLYFSRLTLNPAPSARALIQMLNPKDANAAADAHHRLIWTAFSDAKDRNRDFLWRYDGDNRFYTLSARLPRPGDLFGEPAIKTFEPNLVIGDRLNFVLRANATKVSKQAGGKRVDVVMDLLYDEPKEKRAEGRMKLAQLAGEAWMARQGAAKGFAPLKTVVEGYTVLELGHKTAKRSYRPHLGVLDLSGTLTVTDPNLFLAALAQGFGRAKAWGCGLMMIRRTP
jgi:CRISPR system Cascade subunit CasE